MNPTKISSVKASIVEPPYGFRSFKSTIFILDVIYCFKEKNAQVIVS